MGGWWGLRGRTGASHHPQPASFMREKIELYPELCYIIWQSEDALPPWWKCSIRPIQRADWPHRAEPRLWCRVYSRPTTKTALLPSVVLIKKTAHVEIKQQQQAVCIFRGARVHEWGQKSTFLEWKNPPTGFTKLLHLFPDWLCSPDSLIFFTVSYVQYTAVQSGARVWPRNGGRPLKLLKNWQEKKTWGGGVCLSLKKQTYIFALFKAHIHPSILCCFALWHGATSKQSTSVAAASSAGRSVWL